jgi:hypothetical protein
MRPLLFACREAIAYTAGLRLISTRLSGAWLVLKFFRKYNRIILVVGVIVLMAAFGIGPAIQNLMPGPGDQPIGTAYGEELLVQEQTTAANELRVVQTLIQSRFQSQFQQMPQLMMRAQLRGMNLPRPDVPVPFRLGAAGDRDDQPLAWMLALREARRLGLSASQQEVDQALATLGVGQQQMAQLIEQMRGGDEAFVRQAVRHWLILEQYASLISGDAFANVNVASANPALRKLELLASMGEGDDRQARMQSGLNAVAYLAPSQRLSEPLVQHYVQQQAARVSGKLLAIDSNPLRDKIDKPTEQDLQQLFNQYKDDLPGTGEPWQIGYKYPDRVKLEALILPMDQVRDTVTVMSGEVTEYYNNNQSEFLKDQSPETQPATQASTQPDEPEVKPLNGAVYDQIEQTLTDQKAEDKAKQILSAAENLLEQPLRSLERRRGYRQIPEGFDLPDLEAVKQQLEDNYDVAPKIMRFTDDWRPVAELSALPEIGQARLPNLRQGSLTNYVQASRAFDPPADNPLAALRLQVGVPSQQMTTDDQRLLIRLTAAEASHPPASLDAVRDQVAEHVSEIAAYEALMKERSLLLQQAKNKGLASVADDRGGSVESFGPTTRRARAGFGRGPQPPELPQVGRSAKLIDNVFDFASTLQGGDKPIADLAVAKRTSGIGLEPQRSLVLYQVGDYQPANEQQYQQQFQSATLRPTASQWAQRDASLPNPLSLEALKRRTNYIPENRDMAAPEADEGQGDTSDSAQGSQ